MPSLIINKKNQELKAHLEHCLSDERNSIRNCNKCGIGNFNNVGNPLFYVVLFASVPFLVYSKLY